MELEQAKDAVMEASRQLVKLGLVARTWGNVSCRVGKEHFLITPSGKPYDKLEKSHLVLVALEDLSYPKGIKPSSEKKLHREVYKQRADVHCVIHTHQEGASLAGLLGRAIPVSRQGEPLLGKTIPTAKYGLPGTKTLVKHAAKAVAGSSASTVLLANHGALCFGHDAGQTLEIAKQLETECRASLSKLIPLYGKEDEKNSRVSIPKEVARVISLLQAEGPGKEHVLFHTSPAVLEVSKRLERLPSYLDDFAQIAGTKVPVVGLDMDPKKLINMSKRCNALLVRDIGSLCWATTKSDAEAVEMILEKNCKAALLAQSDSAAKPISWVDSHLMRLVYQKKYSKIAEG